MLLAHHVAFVTGAGSGIGRAGALALAREGARVVVTDRDGGPARGRGGARAGARAGAGGVVPDRAGATARAVAGEIADAGGQVEALALDVGDDAALTAAIEGTADRHGRLDILHSHAGVQVAGGLAEASVADMDLSWRLNVRSHFVAAKAALGPMKAQGGGSIIVTASNSGVQYDRGMIAYCTTKHAAIAMVRQIAVDHARDGVRCNALCPGFIDTPFNAGFAAQMGGRGALEHYVSEAIPMGRWGRVEEVAEAIVYLASDRSAFMTGHALVLDGGECL